jgi:asparagine synthase (glutamine-hydrolysing)
VPLGICLSGGIDSSALTSLLYHDFNLKNIKTFSIVFEKGSWEDESPYIDLYKGTLNNMFSATPSAQTFYDEFEHFITSLSEPVPGTGPYAQYKVMQLAQGNVTVTIDGQGSDEMLGGYNYFFGSYFKELFTNLRFITLVNEAAGYYKKNPSKQSFSYFIYYMLPLWLKKHASKIKSGSISKEFFHSQNIDSTISADLYNPKTFHQSLLQHFEHKLEHLLKWDDHNSMAFSIESRIPFLDHNLVEKTLSLPTESVLKNGVNKFILRESVKDILPEKIYKRYDKRGFSTPADEWFRAKPFQHYINEMLNSEKFYSRGYFDVNECKRKYTLHLEKKENVSNEIWKWINLEIWFRKFIDK